MEEEEIIVLKMYVWIIAFIFLIYLMFQGISGFIVAMIIGIILLTYLIINQIEDNQ